MCESINNLYVYIERDIHSAAVLKVTIDLFSWTGETLAGFFRHVSHHRENITPRTSDHDRDFRLVV